MMHTEGRVFTQAGAAADCLQRPLPRHSRFRQRLRASVLPLALLFVVTPALAQERLSVRWEPRVVRQGDVAMVFVTGVPNATSVDGKLEKQPLSFFPYGDGYAALTGIDLEVKPGALPWRIETLDGRKPIKAAGMLPVKERKFLIQRLTLPKEMVELDEPTERRALAEAARLNALWGGGLPERLWKGRFILPLDSVTEGSGFGSRRIINDLPRSPHAGTDYAADAGTPVRASNRGVVALVDEMFFPGRLVIIDHGFGLLTLYYHLDSLDVQSAQLVEKGQQIGRVGATGRATGPHLHFGVQLRHARLDPETLLQFNLNE